MSRTIALSEFRRLGYTQTQAEELVTAAGHLVAATGISLDVAEMRLRDLVESLGPKPQRYSESLYRSGKGW